MTLVEIRNQRATCRANIEDLLGRTASREMSTEETTLLNNLKAEGERLGSLESRYAVLESFDRVQPITPRQPIVAPPKDEKAAKIEALNQWIRTGRMAADVPLQIEQAPVSGASAAVPTEVLAQTLDAYPAVDTLALLGAHIINRQNTVPLVLPVIYDTEEADTHVEGTAETESTPFSVDDMTLGGAMYDTLIKASIQSLMNVAFNVQEKIVGVSAARILRKQSKASVAGLEAALVANAANCNIAAGTDAWDSLTKLITSISQTYAGPQNRFLLNRTDFYKLWNERDAEDRPLVDLSGGKIMGYPFVLSDDATKLSFGNFRAGISASRTPLVLQRQDEKYGPAFVGFVSYQFADWKFYASLVPTDQPVKYVTLA
jgi:HK97 family phage major capsid protein